MNESNFDWSLVRSFLAAVEHGSLSGAARATGASQPTLGRHIAELERQLGAVLFERTGRGLAPTERALQLADAARSMESGASRLWRLAQGASSTVGGTVRVTASQSVACFLLLPVLARLRETLPSICIELVVSNAMSNLLRREADIALRQVRPDQTSLVARRIGAVTISACAHRDYWRRAGKPGTATELFHHVIVGADRDRQIEQGAASIGLDPAALRFSVRTDDLVAQWAAVRAGLGVGFIADHVIRTDPDVETVAFALPLPRYPVWLTVHREIRTSARIRAVYDGLAREVKAALEG
jgi:DNA-binding transcriptional LysR family regulator